MTLPACEHWLGRGMQMQHCGCPAVAYVNSMRYRVLWVPRCPRHIEPGHDRRYVGLEPDPRKER